MYYKEEFNIHDFNFWSGAKDTIERVRELGKMEDLENLIYELLIMDDELPTKTEINDFVWFEDEMIEQHLGIELYE